MGPHDKLDTWSGGRIKQDEHRKQTATGKGSIKGNSSDGVIKQLCRFYKDVLLTVRKGNVLSGFKRQI